jgi:hypothetical protein
MRPHRRLIIVLLPVVGLLAGIAGVAFSMEKETHDDFCASCHTQPEVEFYRRSVDRAALAFDLAASHARAAKSVRCIDCHGGFEPVQRINTFFTLAVWDTIKFWTGNYNQPARMHAPLPDANCIYCHREAIAKLGLDNHFHTLLADPSAPRLLCVACHPSHVTGNPEERFIARRVVYPQCNACHRQMGKGPSDLR